MSNKLKPPQDVIDWFGTLVFSLGELVDFVHSHTTKAVKFEFYRGWDAATKVCHQSIRKLATDARVESQHYLIPVEALDGWLTQLQEESKT